jgi:hypothetical protein
MSSIVAAHKRPQYTTRVQMRRRGVVAHHVTWNPNKLWRSTSMIMFNLLADHYNRPLSSGGPARAGSVLITIATVEITTNITEIIDTTCTVYKPPSATLLYCASLYFIRRRRMKKRTIQAMPSSQIN